MSEQREIQAEASRKEYHSKLLEIVKAWLPVLTLVIGALWGLYEYIANEQKAEKARLQQTETLARERIAQAQGAEATRRIEAQKPYLELQFKTYLKTTELVGRIIQHEPVTADYKSLRKDFDILFWSELALVESREVAEAMIEMKSALGAYETAVTADTQAKLQSAAIGVAHAIGNSIRSGWKGER